MREYFCVKVYACAYVRIEHKLCMCKQAQRGVCLYKQARLEVYIWLRLYCGRNLCIYVNQTEKIINTLGRCKKFRNLTIEN